MFSIVNSKSCLMFMDHFGERLLHILSLPFRATSPKSSVLSLPLTVMEAFTKEMDDFTIGESDYQRYKAIIEAAKAEKSVEVFRIPKSPSGCSETEARAFLQAGNDSMECSDWDDAMAFYDQLNDQNLGPKSIVSKLSLCKLLLGDPITAFDLSKQAIIDTPLDSHAYLTMAIIKSRLGHRLDSEKLLKLSEIGLNPNVELITVTREHNQVFEEIEKSVIAYFRHTMKFNPDFIECYRAKGYQTDQDSLNDIIASMTRVKENPNCLEEEFNTNSAFACAVTSNNVLPGTIIPRHFSDESSLQFAQADCPMHSINSDVFLSIVKYLSFPDLVAVKRTCRFLEYLGSFSSIYEELVLREGCGPLIVQEWTTKISQSNYRDVYEMLQQCKDFFKLYLKLARETQVGLESSRRNFSDQLSQFYISRKICSRDRPCDSFYSAWSTFMAVCQSLKENGIAKKYARHLDLWEILEFAVSYPSATYYDEYPTLIEVFINLVVLGRYDGHIVASLGNRLWTLLESQVHTDTCAALAVYYYAPRLAQMDLIAVCDPARIQAAHPAHQSRYFVLDGIWQGVQGYVIVPRPDQLSEECIMNLKFPSIVLDQEMDSESSTFEMIGTGIDSFGEFELEDPIIDISTYRVTFTKVYRSTNWSESPIRHYYTGVLYTSGIGGSFEIVTDDDTNFIGYFFYGRPKACANAAASLSPSLPSTSHTATVSWDDLLPYIAERAKKNTTARIALLEQFRLDPNLMEPIYELPLSDDRTTSLTSLRAANSLSFRSKLPSTSIYEMQNILADNKFVIPYELEIDYERYPRDNDLKWSTRRQLYRVTTSLQKTALTKLMCANIDVLDEINRVFKQYNFDIRNEEVLLAVEVYRILCQSTAPVLELNARMISSVIDAMKEAYERQQQVGAVPEPEGKLLSETVRRREESAKAGPLTTTLVASAVAASALALLGAYFAGRFFFKNTSHQ